VSTIAGGASDGAVDGPGAAARFRWPIGVAISGDGTLLVADSVNNCLRAVAPDAAHTVSTYAGACSSAGGMADGAGPAALFMVPVAVAIAPDGGVVVADQYNNRIRRVDPGPGHRVTTLAGGPTGFQDGPGGAARFNGPSGVAVAPDGGVFVLDSFNRAIRRIAGDADHTVTTLVGGSSAPPGYVDGSGAIAGLGAQGGLAWSAGRLFVSDVSSGRIRMVVPGTTAADTTVATLAGSGSALLSDGDGAHAGFALPTALAAGPDGRLWVVDSGNDAVRVVTPSTTPSARTTLRSPR
jgi:hypothetical protein